MAEESFRYTSAPERRERLLSFIAQQGYCTITELSRTFSVSEMTIRRDVARLVEQGQVRGFRGGVGSLTRQELVGTDYRNRDIADADAKRAIAAAALDRVAPSTVIGIDAGTTANQLAAMLPTDRSLRVITNSFPAVASLIGNQGVEVSCLGGVLHPESLSFEGPETLAGIANLRIETLFLAASGLSERGLFCANAFDAITKRALIDVSERVVLLADSSKFSASAMVKICEWDAIDELIIDHAVAAEIVQAVEQHGVQVSVVAALATATAGVGS